MVGRVYPMKFRIRRQFSECSDCDKDLKLQETVTDANNLILLSNCCNVDIYSENKLDNWHIVPVGMISGDQKFSKKVITEACEPKKKVELVPVKEPKNVTIKETKKKKKKKKKKKGAKGKKEKKKK
ncbi:uncharacterized protein LOC117782981 [Drosophila innubila]|uniref:uncharacterized protein LOC117782981 n=1 Tax=Drosophila innubila TaxID=198719 RepID=UPI00148DCE9A|nr:uncharacterized protein LOC117782981 [Drosophila innubila]